MSVFELRPRVDVDQCRELFLKATHAPETLTAQELVAASRLAVFGSPMPCPICSTALTVYDAAASDSHRIDEVAAPHGYRCPACETDLFRAETGRGEGERLVWFWLVRHPFEPELVKSLRIERRERLAKQAIQDIRRAHPCRTCDGHGQLMNEANAPECVDCDGSGVEPGVL